MVVELLFQPGLQAVEALVGFDPHLLDQVIEHVNSTVLFHVYHPAIVYNKKQTDHPGVWHQKSAPCGALSYQHEPFDIPVKLSISNYCHTTDHSPPNP